MLLDIELAVIGEEACLEVYRIIQALASNMDMTPGKGVNGKCCYR